MYASEINVIAKSEEAFKQERHLPEVGPKAHAVQKIDHAPEAVAGVPSLRLKKQIEWGTEEMLLAGLIVWQLLSGEEDYLLILVLLFLLFFD